MRATLTSGGGTAVTLEATDDGVTRDHPEDDTDLHEHPERSIGGRWHGLGVVQQQHPTTHPEVERQYGQRSDADRSQDRTPNGLPAHRLPV